MRHIMKLPLSGVSWAIPSLPNWSRYQGTGRVGSPRENHGPRRSQVSNWSCPRQTGCRYPNHRSSRAMCWGRTAIGAGGARSGCEAQVMGWCAATAIPSGCPCHQWNRSCRRWPGRNVPKTIHTILDTIVGTRGNSLKKNYEHDRYLLQ